METAITPVQTVRKPKKTSLAKTELFSYAHKHTRLLLENAGEGFSYAATFGLVLKQLYAFPFSIAASRIMDAKAATKRTDLDTRLPAIEGVSEKQITFATDMRAKKIGDVLALSARLRKADDAADLQENFDVVENELRTNSDAKFWLDVVGRYTTEETIGRIYHYATA